MSDAIMITDLAGGITFANPAAHLLLCRPNLEGEVFTNLTPSDWIESVQAFEQLAREGKGQQYECELLRADGERCLVRVSSAPLFELGQVTGTVACLHDLTEQRAESRARERSESVNMRLEEAATDAICTCDLNGLFISVNPGFLKESGLQREEVLGHHFSSLVYPADQPAAVAMVAETLAGHRRRLQMRFLGANGPRMGIITTAPI